LEFSYKDFKATLVRVSPQAITNRLETRKIENFSKEKEIIKEPNTNCKLQQQSAPGGWTQQCT